MKTFRKRKQKEETTYITSWQKFPVIPGVLDSVVVPGDIVQAGVGEGAQGGEGGTVVTPLQSGAGSVTNLRLNNSFRPQIQLIF